MESIDIKYLALEGGGGKGVTYLGAVAALEKQFILPMHIKQNQGVVIAKEKKVLAYIDPNNPINGISGSSAGAITGLCLSMGMNSTQLAGILQEKATIWGRENANVFESFFDYPFSRDRYKEVNKNPFGYRSNIREYKNQFNIHFYSRVIDNKNGSTEQYHFDANSIRITKGQAVYGWIKGLMKSYFSEMKDVDIVNAMYGFPLKKAFHPLFNKIHNQFKGDDFKFDIHLKGLTNMGGLFPGMVARDYIRRLIKENLIDKEGIEERIDRYNETIWIKNSEESLLTQNKYSEKDLENPTNEIKEELLTIKKKYFYNYIDKENPYNLTFEQFFYLTGSNLVLTGTNITNSASLYFSKDRTPDFPVADAVLISMNLPVIFPPIWNQANVFQDPMQFYKSSKVHAGNVSALSEWENYNNLYRGLYVDGGIMNNLPIHAFNDVEEPFKYYVNPRQPILTEEFNKNVLGIRLTEGNWKNPNEGLGKVDWKTDFGTNAIFHTLGSALYYSEDGKILNKEQREACVDLYTYDLSTTNFAPTADQVKKPIENAYASIVSLFGGSTTIPVDLRKILANWGK